jgi:tRNA U34 5-carboxymethylaminomethyl modifying GTPase MnmE/TrmE
LTTGLRGLCKELNKKIEETQVDLAAVKVSLDTQMRSLLETIADMRKDLHEELDFMTYVETQTTKALVEATLCEFHTQLKEAEARAEYGECQMTGTNVDMVKPCKFNESTSWTVFRCQFKTTAQHN